MPSHNGKIETNINKALSGRFQSTTYINVNGKRRTKTKTFDTLEEARAFRDQDKNSLPVEIKQKSKPILTEIKTSLPKNESSYVLIISKDIVMLKTLLSDLGF